MPTAVDDLASLELDDAAAWAREHGVPTLKEFWQVGPRGDWMVRAALESGVDRLPVVTAAVHCAALAARQRGAHPTAERALTAAVSWLHGHATSAECWAAGFAANSVADELASPHLASGARASAAAAFACDWEASIAYYAERAHAAEATRHAVQALGHPNAEGIVAAIVRDAIPYSLIALELREVLSQSSFPPPPAPAYEVSSGPFPSVDSR